jgi:hypothetical protein
MKSTALLLFCVCALCSADATRLRVVVDASSPAEYNRWVWQHTAESPGFKHVYITCDSWARRGKFERPAISFWTDSGPLLMHRILPDSQGAPSPVAQMGPILDISPNTDQLTVFSGRDSFAMYNRFGTRLFTDPSRPQGLTSGRWLSHVPYPFKAILLNDKGKLLSTISSLGIPRVLYASDSGFVIQDNDGTVVLFDRDGRVLWRSRKLGSRATFAAGRNRHVVAASTGDSLTIFNPPVDKSVMLPHDKEWGLFGGPTMAWSDDGKLLAIYQASQTAWDSGRVFVLDKEGQLVRPVRKTQLYNVRALLWLGDTLVLPALNVDVSHTRPRFQSAVSADSYVISFLPPRGDVSRGVIHGRFYLYGTWTASGRHVAYTTYRKYLIAEWIP